MRAPRLSLYATALAAAILSFTAVSAAAAQGAPSGPDASGSLTILFTHDLHSSLSPRPATALDGTTRMAGGYARIAAEAAAAKAAAGGRAILVDAGDFTMGTPFHAISREEAAELRVMGAMGYDALTLGNHEFDFHPDGLAATLTRAAAAEGPRALLLAANVVFPEPGKGDAGTEALAKAFDAYGIVPTTMLERGGRKIGLFGILGKDAADDSPYAWPLVFADPVESAKKAVAALKAAGADLVVCLSHGGTSRDPKRSADQLLAKAVPGIDVIVSGHSHTTIEKPLVEGDCLIVSAGSYGSALGELVLDTGKKGQESVLSYRLSPIGATKPEDPKIAALVADFQAMTDRRYFSRFGLRAEEAIAESDFALAAEAKPTAAGVDTGLGNLIADGYRAALRAADPGSSGAPLIGIHPTGLTRDDLRPGPITVGDVFRVLSLGIGEDGVVGYPLISAWVTGAELINILEVQGTIAGLKSDAKLDVAGLRFRTNTLRLPMDRVVPRSVEIEEGDGSWKRLDPKRLYRVVMDLYAGKMVGYVSRVSKGILSVEPKDRNGKPLERLEDAIVDGDAAAPGVQEKKSWTSLADHLGSFADADADGLPELPARYATGEGRIVRRTSADFGELLDKARWTTRIAIGLGVLVVAGLVLGVSALARRRTKRYH